VQDSKVISSVTFSQKLSLQKLSLRNVKVLAFDESLGSSMPQALASTQSSDSSTLKLKEEA
jgi:hypothetical protein